jgi:hypothetical protein
MLGCAARPDNPGVSTATPTLERERPPAPSPTALSQIWLAKRVTFLSQTAARIFRIEGGHSG